MYGTQEGVECSLVLLFVTDVVNCCLWEIIPEMRGVKVRLCPAESDIGIATATKW